MESNGLHVFFMAQIDTHWLQNLNLKRVSWFFEIAYSQKLSFPINLHPPCIFEDLALGRNLQHQETLNWFERKQIHPQKNLDTKTRLYLWLAFNISSKTISTHDKPLPLDPKTMRNEGFIFEKIWVITSNP